MAPTSAMTGGATTVSMLAGGNIMRDAIQSSARAGSREVAGPLRSPGSRGLPFPINRFALSRVGARALSFLPLVLLALGVAAGRAEAVGFSGIVTCSGAHLQGAT